MTLAFMKLLGMSVRIIKQTINIHNMIKSSNLKRMQRTESTVQVKIEDCYFCTESLSHLKVLVLSSQTPHKSDATTPVRIKVRPILPAFSSSL